LIEVGSKESYLQSLHLLRSGILVWPSSGLVLAGIFQFLKQQKKSKQRDNYRNNKGEIRIVFLCWDTPFPYIEEYFNYIPTTYFSKIQHAEHLPFYKELQQSKTKRKYTISCSQLFQKAFIQQKGKLSLSKHRTIYDIRTLQEYQEYHIPWAIHIPTSSECLHQIHRHPKQCTCIVCRYGAKSSDLIAYQKNLNTCYSLKGGMLEWSTKHYPKQQHPSCLLPNNTSNGLQTM
jgi:rhodanese-related sulfurtransferase